MCVGRLMANVTNDKYTTGEGQTFVRCIICVFFCRINALGKFEITT